MTLRSQVNEISFLLKRNVLLDQNEVNMLRLVVVLPVFCGLV